MPSCARAFDLRTTESDLIRKYLWPGIAAMQRTTKAQR